MNQPAIWIPELVDIDSATYIMIHGQGPWEDPQGSYAQACRALRKIRSELARNANCFDPALKHAPLETFWWQQGALVLDLDDKKTLTWAAAMQVGDIGIDDFYAARHAVEETLQCSCANVVLQTICEGCCAQIRHTGSYDNEKDTVATMMDFLAEQGYELNPWGFSPHHEIYLPLKDKGRQGQWDTIFRRPVSPKKTIAS